MASKADFPGIPTGSLLGPFSSAMGELQTLNPKPY